MASELGPDDCWGCGDCETADMADARRVLLAEDVVESSGSSTTSHVCKVASGAKETLRLATIWLAKLVSNIFPQYT